MVQGQSAELTKIGLIYFWKWILANNYFKIVKIANAVHDEALTEAPIKIKDEVGIALKECLEKGGKPYSPIIPLTADVETAYYWVH